MDLKDDEKSMNFRKLPHITSRYFESSAGHLFVNNVNPFESVGGYAGDHKENYQNDEEFIDIFENRPTKDPNSSPSRELVNEILRNFPFDKNDFENEEYDEIHEALLAGSQRPYSQPTVMSSNMYSQYIPFSKDMSKAHRNEQQVRFEEYQYNNENNQRHRPFTPNVMDTNKTVDRNGKCEKTTYCRPLLNMYNQEFVYKTMQRNARLQKLVRKLVIAREREKQREAWNNYINDLKNKHRYYSNEPSRISPQYVPGEHNTAEMIDDYYNTRFNWRHSSPCQRLLHELYSEHDIIPPTTMHEHEHEYEYNRHSDHNNSNRPNSGNYNYDNNRFCYPTSSQASLLRWNKLRQGNQFAYEWRTRPSGRFFRGNTIVVEKEPKGPFDKVQGTTRPHLQCHHTTQSCTCKNKMCSIIRSSSIPIQTDKILPLVTEEDDKKLTTPKLETTKDKLETTKGKLETYQDKLETSKDNKSIYFPYNKCQCCPKKPSKRDKTINVPSKQETINEKKEVDVTLSQVSNKLKSVKNEKEVNKENEVSKQETFKEKFKRVTNNIAKLKNKIKQSEEETRLKSLSAIEQKIDNVMRSINSIMLDIKTKKNLLINRKSAAVSCTFVTTSRNNLHRQHRSDPYGLIRNEEYLCGMVHSSSRSLTISEIGANSNELRRHRESSISRIDKILLEELKKSNKVKRDIEELLNLRNDRNCSVQITFDIPTKERSTEVTDSLSKARLDSKVVVEELPSQDVENRHRQMTIAVNTDPLGLLALLRVSTETLKQLLSYVPNLNYNSYLSMLQLPSRSGRCVSHYICNICGAAFGRPSQLSDHIEQHNLGRTRDCCVCRHSLDLQRTHVALFACRHCGQRFTRAYCCELHEHTCARQLGRPHDVPSGHMLLR